MLTISNKNIFLTRGDTAKIALSITSAGSAAYDSTKDRVVLTVKKSTTDKEKILQKTAVNDVITISHADTRNLEYGDYVYDIQLTTAAGDVYTVITPHRFRIEEEVNFD